MKAKPIETDDGSDPRQCERCGQTITGGIHCHGNYLFLCADCKGKLTNSQTIPIKPIRAYKFNPHIEIL